MRSGRYFAAALGIIALILVILNARKSDRDDGANVSPHPITDSHGNTHKRVDKSNGRENSHERIDGARKSLGERMARERTERMRESGILAKKGAPNYVLIGQDEKITRQAIIESGLDQKSARKLQAVIDRHWESMSKSLVDRAVLDENAMDQKKGLFSYSIPALPDGGAEEIAEFESDIMEITGKATGGNLIRAFDPGSYLGGFGKYDIKLNILRTNDGLRISDFQFVHPKTGIITRKGSMEQDYSKQYFGSLLESAKIKDFITGNDE